MNENRRFETRGTAALACRDEGERHAAVIDYDVARRSYEARVRLAARQARRETGVTARDVDSRVPTKKRSVRFNDVVAESYTPQVGMSESLANMVRHAHRAITTHPFVQQLRDGSISGKDMPGITYRQAFSSASAFMVVSAVLIFVGA